MISRFKEIGKTKSRNCCMNKTRRSDAKNMCKSMQHKIISPCNRSKKTVFVYDVDILNVLLFYVCANMVDDRVVQSCASRLWLIVPIVCL